jgi:BlaI family transcriptional regulator, penicillinase repressor
MAKKQTRPLAAGELEILQLLWNSEGLTLSEAHQAMTAAGRDIGYTTVQTRLERLVEKALVAKNKQRPAVYSANLAPEEVRATMVDSLLGRIAGVVPLFAHLVQDPSLSAADLKEMRRMIDEAERRIKGRGESKP